MIVTRDEKGNVTKVVITEKEYDETCKDYKGVITEDDAVFWGDDGDIESERKFIGKRTWMPPFWVFGYTCLLAESNAFEIIETPKDETDYIMKSFASWLVWANEEYKHFHWDAYWKPSSFTGFKDWLPSVFKDHKPDVRSLYEKFCKEYNVTPCEDF